MNTLRLRPKVATVSRLSKESIWDGRTLLLRGIQPQRAGLMQQAEFESRVGPENICPNIVAALVRAETLYLDLRLAGL
jgi:hypothetical protein